MLMTCNSLPVELSPEIYLSTANTELRIAIKQFLNIAQYKVK